MPPLGGGGMGGGVAFGTGDGDGDATISLFSTSAVELIEDADVIVTEDQDG